MEIEQPVFENMVQAGILDKRHAQSILEDQKQVILRREAASGIENGVIIGSYFSHIIKLMVANKQNVSGIDQDSIKSLKNSVTPAAKLYNWNILAKELEVSIYTIIFSRLSTLNPTCLSWIVYSTYKS